MATTIRRGVAICHYERPRNLGLIIEAVKKTVPPGTKIVVCDDGSSGTDFGDWAQDGVIIVKGQNLGVAANKNRALWALQDCHFLAILEDDLMPTEKGWFEIYERGSILSGIHHFCRVQDREVPETIPEFSGFMVENSCTPIYGPSPRGDLTFLSSLVLSRVGAFNPRFRGAGYAHGEFSERVFKSGLIGHPLKWVDIKEARDKFEQIGDTDGGRWQEPKEKIESQLRANKKIRKELDQTDYIYCPLTFE